MLGFLFSCRLGIGCTELAVMLGGFSDAFVCTFLLF